MKTIDPQDLFPMDMFEGAFPLRVDLAYALDTPPNIFGTVYGAGARLWLHRDLAKIVLLAARIAHEHSGHVMVLYDGLRTKEAQGRMAQSAIVKANPQWMQEPRLLSPPGAGAHPRGMAIDVSLMDASGQLLDMGTVFDHLSENPAASHNPAHRAYAGLSDHHRANRTMLDAAMTAAAARLGSAFLPLPQEWWDFRLPPEVFAAYEALSDADLPPEMRMVSPVAIPDFEEKYAPRVAALTQEILALA